MKSKLIIAMAICIAGITVKAGELVKNFSNQLTNQSAAAPLLIESQSITASLWADGEYAWYTMRSGVFYFDLETEKKSIKLNKDEKGEVVSVEMGKYTYVGDAHGKSSFIRYYTATESRWHLFFLKKCIVIFEPSGENSISILGCLKAKCKPADELAIETYMKDSRTMQEADLKAYEAKKAEEERIAEEEREKKYSIKNKTVSKLEIINIELPEKLGHYATFSFDVKATLSDGTTLSTDNGGFWSDYKIEYVGAEFTENKIQGKFIKDDKIIITATSVFDSNIKATAEVVMLYNQDITFNYTATGWSRSAGENANNFKIEVKQVKHKVNGSLLNAVQITNLTTGVVVAQFKLGVDQTLYFTCNGGYGGSDDGYGKDGGDGGSITVIKDPTVKSFKLVHSNRGGKAGKGSTTSYDGRAGRDGDFNEQVATVTLTL